MVKNLRANMGGGGLILGLGRSPGGENGNQLQYSCLKNSMDRGLWWAKSMRSQRVRQDCVTEHAVHPKTKRKDASEW